MGFWEDFGWGFKYGFGSMANIVKKVPVIGDVMSPIDDLVQNHIPGTRPSGVKFGSHTGAKNYG